MTAVSAGAPGATVAAPLRRMRWWDLEPVLELERALFADPWSAATLLSELAQVPESRWYAVAEDDRGLTGYVGLRTVGDDADVQTIAVAGRAQGRGLGGCLLDALLEQAKWRGCTRAFLEVRGDNAAAQHLYASRGFAGTGTRPDYYGPAQDAVVMTRELGRGSAGPR